jgi:hypothetical protein
MPKEGKDKAKERREVSEGDDTVIVEDTSDDDDDDRRGDVAGPLSAVVEV